MRLVMLTLIGLITALVMARSRRLLFRVVTEATNRTSLARFLPTECDHLRLVYWELSDLQCLL
jgi:adenylate cyclase